MAVEATHYVPKVHAITGPMIGLTSILDTITTALSFNLHYIMHKYNTSKFH